MSPRKLWYLSGLDWRYLVASVLTVLVAPFLGVSLEALSRPDFWLGNSIFELPMIVLIAGAYGLAEAVLALPKTLPFSLVTWLVLHTGMVALGALPPWPGRLSTMAAGLAGCLGMAWHWDWQGLGALDRTLTLALGVIPASFLVGWMVYAPKSTRKPGGASQ